MNKILIIDDDKELCVLIKRSVLSEDIEADFCNTGKEGLSELFGGGLLAEDGSRHNEGSRCRWTRTF